MFPLESKGVVFNLGGWQRESFEPLLIFKEDSNEENTEYELFLSCYRAESFWFRMSQTRELLLRVLQQLKMTHGCDTGQALGTVRSLHGSLVEAQQ